MNSKHEIILYLYKFIPIIELCIKILDMKIKLDDEDTYNYHLNIYNTIHLSYLNSFHYCNGDNRTYYSYIIDDKHIKCEKDRNMNFYNITGISYQVRNILLDVIKAPTRDADLISKDYTDKDLREEDDKLLCLLTKKINECF